MARLWREPLVLFLIAGAAIFAINASIGGRIGGADDNVIEVSAALMNRIGDQWQAQMGRTPTQQELDGLVEQWIREEIYYREARAMGLDDNDTIIRRRLAQKLTFLTEDLADADTTDDAALRAWYNSHQDSYIEPARLNFTHRYFSEERRTDARADATAQLARAAPPAHADPTGDPFMLQQSYASRSLREIGDLFGREFAASLEGLTVSGEWQGPIRSAYGWHLVKLEARASTHLRPFEEVATQVANDAQMARRRDANEALYENLRARYEVRVNARLQTP